MRTRWAILMHAGGALMDFMVCEYLTAYRGPLQRIGGWTGDIPSREAPQCESLEAPQCDSLEAPWKAVRCGRRRSVW